mmetsp:Transcript_29877/g.74106  ORF Transcript_29877/g.74106 Transcript_29877/m.74106 type:complete len:211 (+) Transcript_29877:978-1610(+)
MTAMADSSARFTCALSQSRYSRTSSFLADSITGPCSGAMAVAVTPSGSSMMPLPALASRRLRNRVSLGATDLTTGAASGSWATPMYGSRRARAAVAGRAMGASMQSKKNCQSSPYVFQPREASVGASGGVATCALNSLDVNSSPEAESCVTTESGHRGVGAAVKDSTRPPPRSNTSPDLIVRSRALSFPSTFHAAVRASDDAGVPGLRAA